MRRAIGMFAKILIFFLILLGSYYLLFLRPRLENIEVEKVLSQNYFTLLQNRLSYVELTRLDPKAANFDLEKSNLVGSLKKTNEDGLKTITNSSKLPEDLKNKTKSVYEDQAKLLEAVFATKSYEEGVRVLKSSESVELLTRQTNLLLEYQFQLEKLKASH